MPVDVDAAVLVSRVRREEKQIFAALDRRGVSYAQVDVREMVAAPDLATPDLATPDLAAPDLAGGRWRVALNREISHSRALHAGLAAEHTGRPLINSAAAVEVCGDKWRTALALHDAGLPTPRTLLALSPSAVPAAAGRLGYPVVIKPLTSSWGRRVVPVRDPETAATVAEFCAALPGPQAHIVCVQELIDKPDRDIRVIVVGGEPLGAIYRRSAGWRTNVALGGRAEPCRLTDEMTKYAIGAAAACGAEIAGVDLLEGPGGELYVLEVNHGVEFSGFTQALDVDVAGAIVDHLLTRIERTERVEP